VWRFLVAFFCTGGVGSVAVGAAADFVASGAAALAAGTSTKVAAPAGGCGVEPVPDWLAAINPSW
jgi:hypothetical protein